MSLYNVDSKEFYNFLADVKILHFVEYKQVGKEDWYTVEGKVVAKVTKNYYNKKSYWIKK